MDDAEPMMQRGLGDQEVGDRYSMPHAVVMREVVLQAKRPYEDIRRRIDRLEADVKQIAPRVVVSGGSRREELLELSDRTDMQPAAELSQLRADAEIPGPRRCALVDNPAAYRHISSDASTSRSRCSPIVAKKCRWRSAFSSKA
ncbi:MAG TPA: hypothetical protein VFZ96_07925, partial [Actinomycetota bacterium]|nr:hypothetical protein [Actinomycetota bacterium]